MKRIKAILSVIALSAVTGFSHAAWQHAHGDSANTGLVRVDTAPAWYPPQTQPLGPIAPGANPVVGPDGTVYIGNMQGELRAFHADGRPYWTRKIDSTHGGFFAAPVVGDDGSIYVVSSIHYTDHRGGVTNKRNDSFLHKFLPGGAWVLAQPFPEKFSSAPSIANRGVTTAPPNMWRWNGSEAILIPVVYKTPFTRDLHLLAFSTSGEVLADKLVTAGSTGDVIGEGVAWWQTILCAGVAWAPVAGPIGVVLLCSIPFPSSFESLPFIPEALELTAMQGVAIRPNTQGAPPFIMVTDGKQDKIVYAFSPQTGFNQVARSTHTLRQFTTPPVVLPNGETLTGTHDGYLTRIAQNFAQLGAFRVFGTLTAAPTRLSDGGLVAVSREGTMTVQRGHRSQIQLVGGSIASAAASCNHIFVATTESFVTFDAKTLTQLAFVPWVGGGLHSPIIGPSGYVYAIASNVLFVFPPPWDPFHGTRLPSCLLLPPVVTQ